MIKEVVKKIINHTINKPIYVKFCVQTIYQSLNGCLRLWEFTKKEEWKERSIELFTILNDLQCDDGGFDPGYEYNFGKLHLKGESISSETFALLVLCKYYKNFPSDLVKKSCKKGSLWIKNHAFNIKSDEWAIPYGPYNTNEVMVYNGTSFAAAALGVYLSFFPNEDLEIIYKGMNKYLYNAMSVGEIGKFWYYNDQSRSDLSDHKKNKIDYYHQMQQVEVHSESEFLNSNKYQKGIIIEASKHVADLQDLEGKVSYYNTKSDIHLWGFCSCASGFILASKIDVNKKEEYIYRARKIYDWILKYSWNGNYFYPIISHKNKVLDHRFYVRSDAWIFSSFCLAVINGINPTEYLNICEKSYQKMKYNNFSGIENHASNSRKRLSNKVITMLILVIKKIF